MPAIGNLVLKDGQSTPADHTFAPVTTDGGLARWANRASSTLKGQETLNIEVKAPAGPSGAHRVILGAGDPTEAVKDGVTVVDHVNSVQTIFNFAQASTDQERYDLLSQHISLLSHAQVKLAVRNVEPFF